MYVWYIVLYKVIHGLQSCVRLLQDNIRAVTIVHVHMGFIVKQVRVRISSPDLVFSVQNTCVRYIM